MMSFQNIFRSICFTMVLFLFAGACGMSAYAAEETAVTVEEEADPVADVVTDTAGEEDIVVVTEEPEEETAGTDDVTVIDTTEEDTADDVDEAGEEDIVTVTEAPAEEAAVAEDVVTDTAVEEDTAIVTDAPAEETAGTDDVTVIDTTEDAADNVDAVPEDVIQADPLLAAPVNTAPRKEDFVQGFYRTVLGRSADASGLRFWTEALESGRMSAGDVVGSFFGSAEYRSKNKSNDAVLDDLYRAIMGRAPDAAGKQYWTAYMANGMSFYAVADEFVKSREFSTLCNRYQLNSGSVKSPYYRDKNVFRTSFVGRLYVNCLGRSYDVNGLEYWCKQIDEGATASSVASGFVFSAEYEKKKASDEAYIDMLYRTILGREADASGRKFWTDQLAQGKSRKSVYNGFLRSSEFKRQADQASMQVGELPEEEENKPVVPARGIDVSIYQGDIDWQQVKNSGISFAIIRAGYRGYGSSGRLRTDTKFEQNLKNAQAAGVKVGVYVYSSAINQQEALEEAELALQMLQGAKIELPVFIDMESPSDGRALNISVEMRTQIVHTFCRRIQAAGYRAGVYANKSWFNHYMNTPEFTDYAIWLAHWTPNGQPSDYSRTRYDFWQYSSNGTVPGIKSRVDMNIAYVEI